MGVLLKYSFFVCFVIVYVRIAIPYCQSLVRFMFNVHLKWDKYVDKPRLAFYALGLLFMHVSYFTLFKENFSSSVFFVVSYTFIFLTGTFFCMITWTKKFTQVFIPAITKKMASPQNFQISITEKQLNTLYNGLVKYELIRQSKSTRADFFNVLLKDWDEHDSSLHFNLDAPSCREFYELLSGSFPKNNLSLTSSFGKSKRIKRVDGKAYNYNTIKNAPTRTPISKKHTELHNIFSTVH